MTAKITEIQKTLFGEEIITEYIGTNWKGEQIKIPNFQPSYIDTNPRLDEENHKTKRRRDNQ